MVAPPTDVHDRDDHPPTRATTGLGDKDEGQDALVHARMAFLHGTESLSARRARAALLHFQVACRALKGTALGPSLWVGGGRVLRVTGSTMAHYTSWHVMGRIFPLRIGWLRRCAHR